MLQLRVYRLSLPITILGLELWAVMTVGLGTLLSLQVWDKLVPTFLTLPLSAVSGYLFLKFVEVVKHYFPGRSLVHGTRWLTQGDVYLPQRERRPLPLIVPQEDRFLVKPRRAAPPRQRSATSRPKRPVESGPRGA